MKRARGKTEYRSDASKGHIIVGKFLQKKFPLMKIYQEYSYFKILNNFYKRHKQIECDHTLLSRSRLYKADWVILDLATVIEVQGIQHYQPTRFGNMSLGEAELQFNNQVLIDKAKSLIAKEANWNIIFYDASVENALENNALEELYYKIVS